MLTTLVFIEKNCTFNLEVSRLCVSVSSGHLPTGTPCLIWCADPESGSGTALTTTEVGQCMPYLA